MKQIQIFRMFKKLL